MASNTPIAPSRLVLLRSAGKGAFIGALLGMLAQFKAVVMHSSSVANGFQLAYVTIGIVGGTIAGALWPVFGPLRRQSTLGYYVSWIITMTVVGSALMLPSAIAERSWLAVLFGVFLGAMGGAGLAAYTRYAMRP